MFRTFSNFRNLYAPDAEPTGGGGAAPAESVKGTEAPVQKDPYEGLEGEDRELADAVEKATPAERAQILRLARVKYQELNAPKPEPKKEEPKPEPKAEPKSPLEEKLDKVAELVAKQNEFITKQQERQAQEEAQKQALEADRRFQAQLQAVIDEDEDYAELDDSDKETLREAYLGHFVKHRPQDIKRSFKEFIGRDKERAERIAAKRRGEYVDNKLRAARETRTERGGAAPSKAVKKFTGTDYKKGDLVEALKKKYGE